MPIYEYRCDNCGHELETIQKVSDAPLKTCPACEQETLRKRVSAAAFRLKGGGWYETDFKSDKKRNVAGEDKASSGDGAKTGGEGKGGDKAASDAGSSAKGDGAASRSNAEKSGGEGKGKDGGKDKGSTSKAKNTE